MSLFVPPFDKLRVSGRAIALGLKAIRRSCEGGNLCPQHFRFLLSQERRERGICHQVR